MSNARTVSERVDCVVIGAGVVGLAIAHALAMAGREVLILEREAGIGTGISSRNSEVVHAGIYYPPGSLKARLCLRGRDLLYGFCAEAGVPVARPGKLVVATRRDEIAALRRIEANALACGATGLSWLGQADVRAREPELAAVAALHSAMTGIVDSHALMLALLGAAEAHGAMLVPNTEVAAIAADSGLRVRIGGTAPITLDATIVINAAGLDAPGLSPVAAPMPRYCKGNYFALAGRAPFRHLIYPVPEAAGLGVHLTMDLGGQARFGPDTEWIDPLDYAVDASRQAAFETAIRRYWPGLPDDALRPDYAGVRPKIVGPGEPAADFRIDGPETHGIPGLVSLFGIESPGLTASLAIAQAVAGALNCG